MCYDKILRERKEIKITENDQIEKDYNNDERYFDTETVAKMRPSVPLSPNLLYFLSTNHVVLLKILDSSQKKLIIDSR